VGRGLLEDEIIVRKELRGGSRNGPGCIVEPGGRYGGTGGICWGGGRPLRATTDAGEITARGGMRHKTRRMRHCRYLYTQNYERHISERNNWAMDGSENEEDDLNGRTYIQSPRRKEVFGLGGLVDKTKSW